MTACAEFYQNLLELRGGVLQLRGGSTAFESYWNLEQNLVDQVLLRALFHALLTLNDAYALDLDAAGYQAVLDRLPPLQTETVRIMERRLKFSASDRRGATRPYSMRRASIRSRRFPPRCLLRLAVRLDRSGRRRQPPVCDHAKYGARRI